jgi:hypothetical protein
MIYLLIVHGYLLNIFFKIFYATLTIILFFYFLMNLLLDFLLFILINSIHAISFLMNHV